MAKDSGIGDIVKYGLLAGGGYLAYRYFFSGAAAAAPAGAPAGAPAQGYTLADLVNALKSPPAGSPAAGSNPPAQAAAPGPLTADDLVAVLTGQNPAFTSQTPQNLDQWSWAAQHVPGKPITISGSQMQAIIDAASKQWTGKDRSSPYTALDFMAAYKAAGLSGLGVVRPIRTPVFLFRQSNGLIRAVAATSGGMFSRAYDVRRPG
jgi:hypothetical protein